MSAVIATASDGLKRTTGLVASSSNYTAMCWVRFNSFPTLPDYQTVFAITDFAGITYTGYAGIFTSSGDATKFAVEADTDGAHFSETTSSAALSTGKWYHLTYTRSGNTHSFYVNSVLIGSFVLNVSGVTFTTLFAGSDSLSSTTDMDIADFREWNAAISVLDIVNEMTSKVAVRTSNLKTDTPLDTDLLDDSGNGNDWTAVGSVTFGTNPPIPANYNAANATVITTIPDVLTFAMKATDCDVVFPGWWKYTAVTGDDQIGFYAQGNNTTYRPQLKVFSPNSTTPFLGFTDVRNLPIQFPGTIGQTYYFYVQPFSIQTATNGDLTITVNRITLISAPTGYIAINDDTTGFPLQILSPTIDNDVLGSINGIVAGEGGDILDNGIIALSSVDDDTKIFTYDSTNFYSLVSALTAFADGIILENVRSCQGTQRFWVGNTSGSARRARYIANDGITMGALHTLTGVANLARIAAKNDESILYFAQTGTGAALRQWNLGTDTIMADLVAGIANYQVFDILVNSDDSILVGHVRVSTGSTIVHRYDAAGTLLNTYDFGTSHTFPQGSFPRLAYAIDDPNSFWIMNHMSSPANTSRFSNIKVSDGSTLGQVDYLEYEVGVYEGTPGDTPSSFFGVSNSCPFWVGHASIAVPTGTLTVAKVTSPFDTTTLWEITVTSSLGPVFTLFTDQGNVFLNVPAGTYSVVQTPVTGIDVTYFISNQPLPQPPSGDNLNVVVGANEDVTVMILDTKRVAGSGLYTPVEGKRSDTIVNVAGEHITQPMPTPFFETGMIGDM